MSEKIKIYLREGLVFFVKRILLFDLILLVSIALSFLVWGPFTPQAYSDRLVWTGIVIALIAGVLVSSQTLGGGNLALRACSVLPMAIS